MSDTSVTQTLSDPPLRPLRRLWRLMVEAGTYPGYALSRIPLAGELIAAIAPPKKPPILLVSLPRAGSSWIGRFLGASEGALYLREPLNQSYLEHVGRRAASSFFELGMCCDRPAYERFAALTFKGIPRFKQAIAQYPEQWAIGARTRKQVVVKEVNPLVVEDLWTLYQPKIVFLLRHPVPVVRSFDVLGWTSDKFRTAFSPETLAALEAEYAIPSNGDLWEEGGAFHAVLQHRVMGFLTKVDHTIVRYEDVCEDPIGEFTRIFDFCGLPLSAALRQEIVRSSSAETEYAPGRFDTDRNSGEMKDRWKRDIDPGDIERVRRSYFANRPIFYKDECDW